MDKVTLVILAAGIGSRYGAGRKQLAPVGPNGEFLMDYSIHDALEAGFNKVVFIIMKELEKEFKDSIGRRVEKMVETVYVYQELSDIPKRFEEKLEKRYSPWGTGQAILCCKGAVQEPFLVINADDYYGKEAYKVSYQYLTGMRKKDENGRMQIGMVGFVLGNTLSRNGTVTRGVCQVDEAHMLTDIEETYGIRQSGDVALAEKEGQTAEIALDSVVSMNMWGLPAEFIDILEGGFEEFLESLGEEDNKKEYLLPGIIGELVRDEKACVKVLKSGDKWFGVTYKEDRESVVQEIRKLVEKGVYPEKLYEV